MPLLCSRPHERFVDFETSRFIVCRSSGLRVNGRTLEMGEEVPKGVLSAEALRQVYQTPLHLIETVEFARSMDDPYLRLACAEKGTSLEEVALEAEVPVEPEARARVDLDSLSSSDLRRLCRQHGVSDKGNLDALRKRLDPLVG